jgi:hypothetical protein
MFQRLIAIQKKLLNKKDLEVLAEVELDSEEVNN